MYPNITSSVKKITEENTEIHFPRDAIDVCTEESNIINLYGEQATQAPLHHEDLDEGQSTQRHKSQNPRTTFTHQEEWTPANRMGDRDRTAWTQWRERERQERSWSSWRHIWNIWIRKQQPGKGERTPMIVDCATQRV